jgi:hypothetical protein
MATGFDVGTVGILEPTPMSAGAGVFGCEGEGLSTFPRYEMAAE